MINSGTKLLFGNIAWCRATDFSSRGCYQRLHKWPHRRRAAPARGANPCCPEAVLQLRLLVHAVAIAHITSLILAAGDAPAIGARAPWSWQVLSRSGRDP
jgi:hypothetical protein